LFQKPVSSAVADENGRIQDPEKPSEPKSNQDWVKRRENIIKRYVDNKYLLEHHLGQLKREQEMASAAANSIAPQQSSFANSITECSQEEGIQPKAPKRKINLNAEQRSIADHPPHVPLSVRAGAGTGKTQTMVHRAIQLVNLHGVDPAKILMLTFTNKAAHEMRERIAAEFACRAKTAHRDRQQEQEEEEALVTLPTCKTFHSLAFRWIRTFWRACGLGRYPTLIVTKPQKKKFMAEVIQFHVKRLQLKRCYKYLKLKYSESEASWENVINKMQELYPEEYQAACAKAEEIILPKKSKKQSKACSESQPNNKPEKKKPAKVSSKDKAKPKAGSKSQPSKKPEQVSSKDKAKPKAGSKPQPKNKPEKKKTAKQLKEEKCKEEEDKLLVQSETLRQSYLELKRIADKKSKTPAKCDIETRWKGDTEQCNTYLKLVENARIGQHDPEEYLPRDAAILQLFDKRQEETGQIDFDRMLILFIELLRNNISIAEKFHCLYDYVIVDEYQDNSEVQSNLLLELVTGGRVTVVGDDDQCIYEFRGASPGNFDAFSDHYSSIMKTSHRDIMEHVPTTVNNAVLEENYRSTGNILQVGAKLLEGSNKRGPKTLRPTRESGKAVELWKCMTATQQARQIAKSIKRRHDYDGVSWGQVACLFRCYRMGQQERLHSALQRHLAEMKVPFKVVGGHSFLESAMVSDIVAYITLMLTGNPARMDDQAFERVVNKPARKIGETLMKMIKAHRSSMDNDASGSTKNGGGISTPVALEEAAKDLLISETSVLSDTQKKALQSFFALVHELRVAAISKALPELILFVWEKTGLADMYKKKQKKKNGKEAAAESEESDSEERVENPAGVAEVEGSFLPGHVKSLVSVAEAHVKEWKEYKDGSTSWGVVDSLSILAKKCLIQHADKIPPEHLPQFHLPPVYIEELYVPGGIGLAVVNSFLADLALQMAEEESVKEDDRVTISTIHRAKGLEWSEVYIPFFNEGYMPTSFREETWHQKYCKARNTNRSSDCSMDCARFYAKRISNDRGLTPEQRHSDEERRLAHVAATRAKDRLIFISIKLDNRQIGCKQSSFEACLEELPETVFEKKRAMLFGT
jgi:superfamily I DNA/RNA helicase